MLSYRYLLYSTLPFVFSNCLFTSWIKKSSAASQAPFTYLFLTVVFTWLGKSFYPAFLSGKNYRKIFAWRNLAQPLLWRWHRIDYWKRVSTRFSNNFRRQMPELRNKQNISMKTVDKSIEVVKMWKETLAFGKEIWNLIVFTKKYISFFIGSCREMVKKSY